MPTVYTTGDVTTNVTAFADVTGLTFTVAAAAYHFRFVLHHSSAATTTGIRFAINGPAASAMRVGGMVALSTVGANFGSVTAYDTAVFAASVGTTAAVMSIVEGVIVFSSSGTLACRVASEAAAATVTVLARSSGVLTAL